MPIATSSRQLLQIILHDLFTSAQWRCDTIRKSFMSRLNSRTGRYNIFMLQKRLKGSKTNETGIDIVSGFPAWLYLKRKAPNSKLYDKHGILQNPELDEKQLIHTERQSNQSSMEDAYEDGWQRYTLIRQWLGFFLPRLALSIKQHITNNRE